jgi:uncharacterized membrane protein YjgN (DUF898 family)
METGMAFCNNCGTEINSAARFCTRCGASIAPAVLGGPVDGAPQVPVLPSNAPVHRFTFHGSGGELFLLYLKVILLSIVTLGIYSFWGRTQLRQFFAENSRFDNVAFAYNGTGFELFTGWLKALGVVAVLFCQVFLFMLLLGEKLGLVVGGIVFYVVMFCFIPLAMVGAWRYRTSRTSLRGIRFSFRGDFVSFLKIYVPGALLTLITFGIYTPIFLNNIRRFYCRNAHYGNAPFHYDGEGRDLLVPWIICLVATPFTLGVSMVYFNVLRFNYQWNHTSFQGARFVANVQFVDYLVLVVTNALLAFATLGIATPWVILRVLRFQLERVTLQGDVHMERIMQEFIDASPVGEGITTFLDTGATDIGLGV